MKSIYTKIDGTYYQIEQNTNVPKEMTRPDPGVQSNVLFDAGMRSITQKISINTLDTRNISSNKELCRKMFDDLKSNKITEIEALPNRFKIFVDYAIIENDMVIDHSCVIRPVLPKDKIFPLGVAANNEAVYRRVKELSQDIEFRTRVEVPHGIMRRATNRASQEIRINNIILYIDRNPVDIHESTYENPYGVNSVIMQGNIKDLIPIFSTDEMGYEFTPTKISFLPRTIKLDIDITFTDLIVVYNDSSVKDILIENFNEKYNPSEPEEPGDTPDTGDEDDPDRPIIPNPDNNKPADGDYTPDEDGLFDYYVVCTETTPDALQVVEDSIPDLLYDPETMIKKSMVIKDIPDIEVGMYVLYCEALDQSFL